MFSARLQDTRNSLADDSSVHSSENGGKLTCSENALTLPVNLQNTCQGKMSVASTKGLLGMVFRVHPTWGRGKD